MIDYQFLARGQDDFYRSESMNLYQDIREPMEAEVITARRKLRNDHGPDGTLSEPEQFVLIDGLYYGVAWIKSGQGFRREQLEVQS